MMANMLTDEAILDYGQGIVYFSDLRFLRTVRLSSSGTNIHSFSYISCGNVIFNRPDLARSL